MQNKATHEIDQMLAAGTIQPEEYKRLRAAIETAEQIGRPDKNNASGEHGFASAQAHQWPWLAMIGFGIYITLMLAAIHAVGWVITDKLISIFDQLGAELPAPAILVVQALRFLSRVYYLPVILVVVALTLGYGRIPEKTMRRLYGRCVTGVIMVAGGALFVGLCSYIWRMADHVPWE